jgi:hypothetical protein
MHAIIGLYMWEFFNSLDFEWQVMTGQKRFRWPLVRSLAVYKVRCADVSSSASTLLDGTHCSEHSSECVYLLCVEKNDLLIYFTDLLL